MEKSKNYADKSIVVTESTKKAFDAVKLKKGKSADELISELLKSHGEQKTSESKNLELRCKALEEENAKLKNERVNQPQPAPTEAPTIEAPTESSEVAETNAPIEPVKIGSQQCRFYRFNNKKQLVECSKDFITKSRTYSITELTCDWCWKNPQCPGRQTEHANVPEEQISKEEPAPNSPSSEQKPQINKSGEEQPTEDNFFDCARLCKKFDKCRDDMNTSMNMLNEITMQKCYDSTFPFINPYNGKPSCQFQEWKRLYADDSEHPYPKCNALQKDVPFQLPKDRLIRNPNLCWSCILTKSKKRKEAWNNKQVKKYIKQDYRRTGDGIDSSTFPWGGIDEFDGKYYDER
jgi:hypothetical protein